MANRTALIECKNRWLCLRQRFSKERQLWEQETRSGAQKPTRQKWVLFDSLNFLKRHIPQRRGFSNVNCMKQSSSISETLLKNKHSMIIQKDKIFANDDSNHKTSASISSQYTLSKGISHTVSLVANEETSLSSTSSYRSQTPVSERSDLVSPLLSCFSGNQQRAFKKEV
ncbi:uncharacterized protein [Linepithema humile]|uniref:uncharacterized protein n=1 Tax=Linepithema humile TaxID=83485 RepID=UPI00351E0EB2